MVDQMLVVVEVLVEVEELEDSHMQVVEEL